ncbi:serine hydrolase [Cytophagaceae bacterium ABcell3]|nr:serine hydrolase [Cytophagaceae bacterium ABcell3]
MRPLHILILSAILFAGCKKRFSETAPCNGEAYSHPKAQTYQALLDHYVEKGMPGIILRIEDDQGIWAGSAGKADISRNKSMQVCHVSKAASLTKTYMATLAFLLADEGRLDLEALAKDYLPREVVDNIPNIEQVTIRQLMNHQTGIFDIITDTEFYLHVLNQPPRKHSAMDLIKFVYNKPANFTPGASAQYSNTNTLLLSMAIDKATGQSHASLLREKILQPYGLSETYYYWHDAIPNNTAQGYFDLYNNNTLMNLSDYDVGTGHGYNGIYATASDLHKFLLLLQKDKAILSHESLEEMNTFHPNEDRERYHGAGVMKDFIDRPAEEQGIGHRGRDLAYSADLYYFPAKGKSFSLLVNYGTDAASNLRPVYMEFRDKVVDELMKPY